MRRIHPVWMATLAIGQLAFAAGTVVVTYNAPSGLAVRQKPPLPALGGAATTFKDPSFGTRILRVTGPRIQSNAIGSSFRTPAEPWAHNWNADGTMFWLRGEGGILPFRFNPSTMQSARLDSAGETTGGLFLSFSGPFSYRLPNILYANLDLKIITYDFNSLTYTTVFDAAAAVPGAPSGSAEPSVSDDDTKLCMAFSGSTESFQYVAVLDRTTGKYSVLDTVNSKLNGQPVQSLGFRIAKAYMERSGRFVMLSPGGTSWYVWNLQTAVIMPISEQSAGAEASGFGVRVNEAGTGTEPADYVIRSLDAAGLALPKLLVPLSLTPTPHIPVTNGSISWNNAQPDRLVPVVAAHYRDDKDAAQPWRAWDDEILAIATDGTQKVWRFAQHRSLYDGTSTWDNPHVSVSQDGRWCLFTSNWERTLGKDMAGKTRQDVFLVELAAATTAPVKVTPVVTTPPPTDPIVTTPPPTSTPTTSVTPLLTYTSPYCGPAGGSTYWACGAWPSTTPPKLGAAGTTVKDPDTQNRVLRVTQPGSFGETANTVFKVYDGGWRRVWNADSTSFLVVSWNGGLVKNSTNWVKFQPSNMTIVGSNPVPYQFTDVEWDQFDANVLVGIASGSAQAYNVATKAWTMVFDPSKTNWGGKPWLSAWGGNSVCIAGGPQDTGNRIACYDRAKKVTRVFNLQAQTLNGAKFPVYYKGQPASLPAGITIHTMTMGQEGRYLALDVHGSSMCSVGTLSNYANTSLILDLEAGSGYEMSIACGGTHWAYGYNSVLAQSSSPRWTATGADGACNSDSRGMGLRKTDASIDSSYVSLAPCSFYKNATWSVSLHLSWMNNANDSNVNRYPVIIGSSNEGVSNSFLWGDIAAMETAQPAYQNRIWRFAQTWNDKYTDQCWFVNYASPSVSRDGRWAVFLSDWRGQTGSGSCTNNKRTDVFVFELK